ncbi:hypothetical protein ACK8P5_12105 [Paenibacillus sp. EC2-1]|uniref:hypothetical protein n=1 Tax=Paenibacillus sp. EC2-1 TaxID=3388665 RepID=UPI003BEF4A51
MGSTWWKISFYFLVFVFALFMSFNDYSPILTVGLLFVATILAFSLFFYYPLLLEKRISRLESFLRKQKKTPAIYVHYVLANRLEDEAGEIMEQLMSKYKQSGTRAIFQAAFGVYQKDMDMVREALPDIQKSDYRAYYETTIHIENGEMDRAHETLNSIKKHWMRLALLVDIEMKSGNQEAAIQYAREVVTATRGVNRYTLYKEYERELPQAVEGIG